MTDSRVHASISRGWYGWSCKVTRSSPTCSVSCASAITRSAFSTAGVRNVPKTSSCP